MKDIKKIVFIISNISIGGAQRITLILVDWMIKKGIDAKIVAVGASSGNYNIASHINVEYLNHVSNAQTFSTINKLRCYLRKEKPQVVITMGVATCLFSVPAVKCVKGVKHIISERNDPRHFLGKSYVKKISRFFMKSADGFVFQTNDAKDYYSKSLKNRGVVISNPIMATNIPNALSQGKKNYIVTMGRLTKQKNHCLLIDAFELFNQKYPQYKLHIYGSGELEEETKAYAATKAAKNNIVFFSACNDVLEKIKDAKAFVLTSDFEGMPNALIEAMAMGLPCISTDCPCGGPRVLIKNKVNGILIPVGGVKELFNSLVELVENEGVSKEIAKEAQKIRETLNTEKISKEWIDYVKTVC